MAQREESRPPHEERQKQTARDSEEDEEVNFQETTARERTRGKETNERRTFD